MNMDLEKILLWAYQWKVSLNTDISKQAQEVTFSEENVNTSHPLLYFKRTLVIDFLHQKHLAVYLDQKLSFHKYMKEIITKASKGIGIIKKLNNVFLGKLY